MLKCINNICNKLYTYRIIVFTFANEVTFQINNYNFDICIVITVIDKLDLGIPNNIVIKQLTCNYIILIRLVGFKIKILLILFGIKIVSN